MDEGALFADGESGGADSREKNIYTRKGRGSARKRCGFLRTAGTALGRKGFLPSDWSAIGRTGKIL